MSLRFLLGILASGPPDEQQDFQNSETEIRPQGREVSTITQLSEIQNAAKFHIGMLSISLITGLAFIGFTIWWMEKKPFISYVINLLIALVCKCFFSILFDGVTLLGSGNLAGGNALMAFEQICINLVLAFWLSLTIYLHARVQRSFKSEPTLNLYKYGVPGAAVFFAFIWIFLLQAEFPFEYWWLRLCPSTQWVVNSFNLLCMLIQLALVGDIARIMMKMSLDNDSVSLFRKASIMMGVLVFIFWLQFGLFMGRLPVRNSLSYTYFFYFVDGIECALVCLILYFFNNWVQMFLNSDYGLMAEGSVITSPNRELLAGSDGRGIVTLDSVFMTNESGKLRNSKEDKDVVYSNVVDSKRWEKILDLYKRLNDVPSQQGTVVEGDEFYDCPIQTDRRMSKRTQRSISEESRKRTSSEDRCAYKNDKICDQIQKKNAFYSSKYLILDAKCEVPKYLETRPSLSSMSGRSIPKEGRMSQDYSPDINSVKSEELVQKWLSDNSKNMSNKDSLTQRTDEEPIILDKKPSELETSKQKPVPETAQTDLDTTQHTENRVSVTQKIISTLDSVLWFPFSGDGRKKSTTKDEGSLKQEATGQHLSSKASTQTSETITSESDIEKELTELLNQSNNSLENNIPSTAPVPVSEPPEIEKEPTESLHQSNNSLMDKVPSTAPVPVSEPAEIEKKPTESLNQSSNSLMDKIPSTATVPVSEPPGLRLKPETPQPEKNEKFEEETPTSNAQIKEKNYEPGMEFKCESDAEESKAKGTYLNQYLTNSELEERRKSREKRENDQQGKAPKSIFSFPQTISSMVGYFFNGRGNLLGLGEPKLSNTENLIADIVPRSENKVHIERQSLKTDMKYKTEFPEQTYTPTTVPSEAISEEEHFPEKKISISSGSEFSIERFNEEQPPQELGISISKKLPKSTDNPRFFAMEDSSLESAAESRKSSSLSSLNSFSVEDYYQQLFKAKQKKEQKNQQRTSK